MTECTITANNPGAAPVILTTISDALTNLTLDPGQVGSLTAPVSALTVCRVRLVRLPLASMRRPVLRGTSAVRPRHSATISR